VTGPLTVFAVASPYAWDVVETAWRAGFDPGCVDNFGGADPRLPRLTMQVEDGPFVLGLAAAQHRAAAAHRARAAGLGHPVVLVDPSAVVARTATLGHGSFLNAGVVVAPHTTVGCHVNLDRSVSIGQDNELGFACSFGPGAVTTGGVVVGAATFVGAGAIILPGVRIGRRATIGAGAVVTKDVDDFGVVVGNPARAVPHSRALEPVEDDRCPHC
jgi:sugar O-acyltransferase (sialic acid O-acetyltransferase NeuD family)